MHVAVIGCEYNDRIVGDAHLFDGIEQALKLIIKKGRLRVIAPEILTWHVGTVQPALDLSRVIHV